MKNSLINNEMLDDVIQHMNEDHSDACLVLAQTLGDKPAAQSALMVGMDSNGIHLAALMADDSKESVYIAFNKPITQDSQIRGHIVALTRRARAEQ